MADEATTQDGADETSVDTPNQSPAVEPDPPGAEALGDPGKKALEAMKAERKAARDEAAALKAQLDALQAKVDGREAEFAAQQQAQRVKDEALAGANERIVSAELRAAAKGKIADDVLPDLTLFIKPSDFEVGDDGSVDEGAIATAIAKLLSDKPSLAAQGSRFQGSADGGARKDSGSVGQLPQLNRSDMERMSPEQIVDARAKGQFADLLSGP